MRSLIYLVFFFIPLMDSIAAGPADLIHKVAEKSTDKNLNIKEFFPVDSLKEMHKDDQYYQLVETGGGDLVAYAFASSAYGRYEAFDYFIIYDLELTIIKVQVYKYRSTHGGAIAGKRWLRQFSGHKGDELQYGQNVQAVSGATISGNSIVNDARRASRLMESAEKKLSH